MLFLINFENLDYLFILNYDIFYIKFPFLVSFISIDILISSFILIISMWISSFYKKFNLMYQNMIVLLLSLSLFNNLLVHYLN